MSTWLLLACALSGEPGSSELPAVEETTPAVAEGEEKSPEIPERTLGEIRQDLSAALTAEKEKRAGSPEDRRAAVLDLTRLYCEIAGDKRLPDSETLSGLRVKLRARLIDIRDEMKRRQASTAGKKARPGSPVAAGGAGVADHAAQLIAVIESTIAPDSWESAGGPGTIRYYATVHALVVRASSDVHGDLTGLLEGLRAVSR